MHASMKLGRTAPTAEQRLRALPLKRYMTRPLPPPPEECINSKGAPIAMWGNDKYGDCTIAALANTRAVCSVREGSYFPTTEADVVKTYLAITGGEDRGAVEHDVLNAALRGVDLGGGEPWRLAAWVTVDMEDVRTCKALVSEFWSLYLGVMLPITAQDQAIWSVGRSLRGDASPGSWGGHAVIAPDYYRDGMWGLATWGIVKKCTQEWIDSYCDEAHLLLDADRAAAIGVDWDRLVADMAEVAR